MKQIKAFARLCGTTERTLRFYDRLGLLTPAYTDPSSGYRHYADEQQARFALISHYKEMGFTLEQIRASLLVDNRAEVLDALRAQEQHLKQAHARCLREIEILAREDMPSARLLRFDRESRVVLWQGEAVRVFSLAPEDMETCCHVLGTLFAENAAEQMRISVADIPASEQDRMLLTAELSGTIDALLSAPAPFEEHRQITSAMFYLQLGADTTPEDIERLIAEFFDDHIPLIWGAAFGTPDIEPRSARISMICFAEETVCGGT